MHKNIHIVDGWNGYQEREVESTQRARLCARTIIFICFWKRGRRKKNNKTKNISKWINSTGTTEQLSNLSAKIHRPLNSIRHRFVTSFFFVRIFSLKKYSSSNFSFSTPLITTFSLLIPNNCVVATDCVLCCDPKYWLVTF